jgi:hypothetical protein
MRDTRMKTLWPQKEKQLSNYFGFSHFSIPDSIIRKAAWQTTGHRERDRIF